MSRAKLFEPFELIAGVTLRNRVAMAPMTTWASNDDGTVSDAEDTYYRRRVSGVGLVITGCTHVQANGVGFTGEFAAHDDAFVPSLRRLAAAAKSGGAPAILQIFHAGAKAPPDLVPEVVAASAVAIEPGAFNGAVTPRALSDGEVPEVVRAFGETTRRAILAGFDGVELHGAHAFLIQNFLSPHFNRREDAWGGSLDNRMRFPLAVVEEVRRVIAAHADRPFALGYRISPEEPEEDGLRIGDTLVLVDRLVEAGIDYLHASLQDAPTAKPLDDSDGATIARILVDRVGGRIPVIAAGRMRTPEEAARALSEGLSLVAIGQGLVMNPDWVELAASRRQDAIAQDVAASDVPRLAIPEKLWTVIEAATGWFKIRRTA
ncbi:NADH:flavin oxidoreductase [Methylobacterium sp. Leaf86]|uniref:NADH-dependent flavin oxidoreductase n=1 Tax=Methylobacterium sp. Leaf86 TaxID=1736242 RepID=UPI0006F5BF37|nr:NADH-dependent flavin oxidoreductase [Methylobacterium sp. Leaf86]KQO61030.1 NADH:flavin oxidoreductase [Methylobacterium sp. Leaf86]